MDIDSYDKVSWDGTVFYRIGKYVVNESLGMGVTLDGVLM